MISSPTLSNTTFQIFQGTSELFAGVFKIQYHRKLCFNCSMSLVSVAKKGVFGSAKNLTFCSWFNSLQSNPCATLGLRHKILCCSEH